MPILWLSLNSSGKRRGSSASPHPGVVSYLPLPSRRTVERRVLDFNTVLCCAGSRSARWEDTSISCELGRTVQDKLFLDDVSFTELVNGDYIWLQSFGIQMPFQPGKCQEFTLKQVTRLLANKGHQSVHCTHSAFVFLSLLYCMPLSIW